MFLHRIQEAIRKEVIRICVSKSDGAEWIRPGNHAGPAGILIAAHIAQCHTNQMKRYPQITAVSVNGTPIFTKS